MSKLSELSNDQKSRWLAERIFPGQDWKNQWRDMVNDPAMTVMLIEKMPYVCIYRVNGMWRIWPTASTPLRRRLGIDAPIEHAHFGQAVVDAVMLQMGWKEK